jgi:hypothetical protein
MAGVATVPARAAAKRLPLIISFPLLKAYEEYERLRSHVYLNCNIAIVDVPSLYLNDLGLFATR